MSFQKGKSGNPKGRPKGAISKRTQLAKLFEADAEKLIAKTIELALDGDPNAIRLCIERIVPKVRHEPIDLVLPEEFNQDNVPSVKDMILRAAIEGRIGIADAEKLIEMVGEQSKHIASQIFPIIPKNDPVEASRIYQKIMMDN